MLGQESHLVEARVGAAGCRGRSADEVGRSQGVITFVARARLSTNNFIRISSRKLQYL